MTLFLTGCLPEQSARLPGSTAADELDSTDSTDDETDGTEISVAPYWLDSGERYQSLTIDYNNQKNQYLFGTDINEFLKEEANYAATYCLRARFSNLSSAWTPLMVKATPATTYDYSTGKKSRYFRVNLGSSTGNSICSQPIGSAMTSETYVYKPGDVCPTCLNIMTSTELTLFRYESAGPNIVPVTTGDVPYQNLKLRIDMNGNSAGNIGTCSDAGCSAQGFDCCINGQCVNDGAVKYSGQQSDPSGFALAELEKATDPNWYINYPQFYYICLEDPGNGGTDPIDPEDPEGEAQARLEKMLADYACVEELKTNSLEDPFHHDPINESLPASSYTQCDISADTTQEMHYTNVMKRLYQNCGCGIENDLDEMVSSCPEHTYKLVYKTDDAGNLTSEVADVACVTPDDNDNQLPFQNLEVMVNSRSAPHRFFSSAGDEINAYADDYSPNPSITQEGTPFQYLDSEKLFPLNGAFNMNSVLGQMTVTLDQARPAKQIDLEFDKVYYIAVLEGMYTACPSCSKDSWFANFSPSPVTSQGLGVRSSGFTTSRDSWGSNSSFANYEDAIFGRACWVPPTMLPFSHTAEGDAQTQRLNRLEAQAAMYINGYQRDWYGFNKGALIGSFDGVTWFAIGKGRKVRATSDRLYLAINAPFADLASPTDHTVSVQEYDFITTAADYDYNPEEEINSPFQNEAGLCQKQHECETDAHCISKLGWEYSCVEVGQYRTKWPSFSAEGAQETAGSERTGGIAEFLQQGSLAPGMSSKRCVYRGAGAPCRKDLRNITNEAQRKALACAPNFYCAGLSSGDFNKEVARYGGPLEAIVDNKNHLFGQDANVLGRPKNYVSVTGGSSLPASAQSAIAENLTLMESGSSGAGLCRPAKNLPNYNGSYTSTTNTDQLLQHEQKDNMGRADFISQIAGCNSRLYTSMRYASCPMLDQNGNYLHLTDEYLDVGPGAEIEVTDSFSTWAFSTRDAATKYYSTQQNMCGMEAIDSNISNVYSLSEETLRSNSAFKMIEARDLASSDTQMQPTLAQNSCFRRAGSVCHTNYDCAPNYKHSEIIDLLNPDLFGNEPERKYWEEYLVCGQGEKEPILTGTSTPEELEAFNSYTMANNRCCREVGKDISIYTEDSPSAPESQNLRTDVYGGFQPNNPDRYSRFANALPQVDDVSLEATDTFSYASRVSAKRPNDPTLSPGDPTILTKGQWRNIHDSAARTCCGGSWVRKFADGTNDWSRNRLNLDVNNLKCLNYKTPLYLTNNPGAFDTTSAQIAQDLANICPDPSKGSAGCGQAKYPVLSSGYFTRRPELNTTMVQMVINSDPEEMESLWEYNEFAFMQLLSLDNIGVSSDGTLAAPVLDWTYSESEVKDDQQSRTVIHTRIPTFMHMQTISDITIELEHPTSPGTYEQCAPVPSLGTQCSPWYGMCGPVDETWESALNASPCYYAYQPSTRSIKVAYNSSRLVNPGNFNQNVNSLKVTYVAPGTALFESLKATGSVDDEADLDYRRSATPGNDLYYLEKLARLEYIGIPQMTYDPIFCNDNYQKLVPGIFKDTTEDGSAFDSVIDFINHSKTFVDDRKLLSDTYWKDDLAGPLNVSNAWSADDMRKVADQELLAHDKIFSDHDFKCCMPLGSKISSSESASICCSGRAREDDSTGARTCALPAGTDLNVYFNKFVSGEGLSSENLSTAQPLVVEDFDEVTGEPKGNTNVIQKLRALGAELCESGVTTTGGGFGPFDPQPTPAFVPANGSGDNKVWGFVDSPSDSGSINNRNVGYDEFSEGYRWNHHVYCGPGDGN